MSTQVDVLAVLDRQLRDRAERANRYRKNAEKSARKSGEPQITADRMAAYTDLQLVELREVRAAVAALIAERDALLEEVAALRQQPAPVVEDTEWHYVDSCGGFYGSDPVKSGMTGHVNKALHDALVSASHDVGEWVEVEIVDATTEETEPA